MNTTVNAFAGTANDDVEVRFAANDPFEIRPLSMEELSLIGGGECTPIIA